MPPLVYENLLVRLQTTWFCGNDGQLILCHDLRRWHIIASALLWSHVKDAMATIDPKHRVKLKWTTDFCVPI